MDKKLKERHDNILQTMKKYQQDILNKFMAEARTLYKELKVLRKSSKFISYAITTFEAVFEDEEFAMQTYHALCDSEVYRNEISWYYGSYDFYELEELCRAYQAYEKAIEELEVACIV